MTRIHITCENDKYEIIHKGVCIFRIYRNGLSITFKQLPAVVQDEAVLRMTDSVIKDTENPYNTF